MARPLRIQYENAYYHVTCRGNGRQAIFLTDSDRRKFLESASRSLEIYRVELLAFVLMTNHFHLIVKTPGANLHELMRHFNISYTAYFNKRHTRAGHLYQGRYKSFLIDADSYLLEVSRYLHLNPIHTEEFAAATDEQKREYLRNYPWSSYTDYVAGLPRHTFLSPGEVLSRFRDKGAYREFVEKALNSTEKPLEKGKGHGVVGDAAFIERVVKQAAIRPEREKPAARKIISRVEPERILRAVAEHFRTATDEILKSRYRGPARSIAMELLYRHAGMNQREIGELMGVDYSTVSVAGKRLRDAVDKDGKLLEEPAAVEASLCQE